MAKEDLVDGMSVTTFESGPGHCEDCIMGKQTCRPFDTNKEPETGPLECIFIDLWGPSCTQSNGGKSYLMQAVDSASAHTEGYFLANKCAETTLEAFKAYHVMAERQTGKKLCCVRTDKGPEFVNELWKAYCTGHSIIHEMTTAYSFQSNGIVK